MVLPPPVTCHALPVTRHKRSRMPHPISITPTLWLVPLDLPLPGFTDFIGAWVCKGEAVMVIDPGPAATIPVLTAALKDLGIRHLDAILLTHIHLDHGGGAGQLSAVFPEAPVICHQGAIVHLADPERLWQGSLKTIAEVARAYGQPVPVPSSRLVSSGDCRLPGLTAVETPGHAVHHLSFVYDGNLFAGEATGVHFQTADGGIYLRPATPPRFFLEISLNSLETLDRLPHRRVCFGHFGASDDTPAVFSVHRNQLLFWGQAVADERSSDPGDGIAERCMARLLATDPNLAAFDRLPPAVQQRERYFMANSIRGYLGWLSENVNDKVPQR